MHAWTHLHIEEVNVHKSLQLHQPIFAVGQENLQSLQICELLHSDDITTSPPPQHGHSLTPNAVQTAPVMRHSEVASPKLWYDQRPYRYMFDMFVLQNERAFDMGQRAIRMDSEWIQITTLLGSRDSIYSNSFQSRPRTRQLQDPFTPRHSIRR